MSKGRGQKTGHFACQPTEKGFKWGPVEIERIETEPDVISGGISLRLKTENNDLEIYITPAGMVRIYVPAGEMVMVQAAGRTVQK